MDHLPLHDAPMLASAINFLLRDNEFESLDDICSYFNAERAEVEEILAAQGFSFNEELNKVL